MLLAIPVSASDAKNLPHTAEIFKKFGPYAGFQCAIFARLEIENEARVFAEQIKPLFSNLDIHIIDFHSNGATEAAAKHFRAVAQTVSEKYTAGPWYFYELDNTPIQIGWLSKLQREHHESGKAHMGAIVPTRGFSIMQDGSLKPSFGDPHMVGTGIYHHAMGALSPNIGQLDRSMPWAGPLEPYDIRLRYEVVPHAHNTILIQHNWNTGNYRVENGQIVCDDLSGDVNLSHAKPYDGHAVVVHGCKDGSLAKLVLADKITTKASDTNKVEPKKVVEEPKSLTGQEGQLPSVGFLAFRIKGVVEASKDRLTAKKIAEQLGVKIEEIVSACSETGSGLKVAGPPKWVSLA
jgi:hypothetical protein